MKYVLTNLSLYVSIDIICSKKHLALCKEILCLLRKIFFTSASSLPVLRLI